VLVVVEKSVVDGASVNSFKMLNWSC